MRFLRSLTCCFCAFLLPAAVFAASAPLCKCGAPTPESYKWNFSKEAASLMKQINYDAYRAKSAAGILESYDRAERELIDWHADANLLSHEKYWANDMDQKLCRVEVIARVLPTNQKAEIKALAPAVIEFSNTTQATLQYLTAKPHELFIPAYEGYAPDLYHEAGRIETATAHAREYVEVNYKWNVSATQQDTKRSS